MTALRRTKTWLLCSILGLAGCGGPADAPSDAGSQASRMRSLVQEDGLGEADGLPINDGGALGFHVRDAGVQVTVRAQTAAGFLDGGTEGDGGTAANEEPEHEGAAQTTGIDNDGGQASGAGPGFSAFAASDAGDAPPTQISCGNDEHEEDGVCVANERSCDLPNGQGVQEWTGTRWGGCVLVACDEDFHPVSGRCGSNTRICLFTNGFGIQTWSDGFWGSCVLDRCKDGYHAENGVCYDNVRPCVLPNGQGNEEWQVDEWSDCIPKSCDRTYHIEGSACISDVRNVDIPYGSGTEQWDGSQWSAFVLTSCDDGYHNGGDDSCVPTGQCITGYNLDPSGKCVFVVSYVAGPYGMEFARIPAGTFTMGSPANERGRSPNETPHLVRISQSYLMGMTEVTQAQWRAVSGENPAHFSACGDNCPVESVAWYATLAYANALSESEGLEKCYTFEPSSCADDIGSWADGDLECDEVRFAGVDCTGYRLPTEAEWEYAYRGGTASAYYSGDIQEISYSPTDPNLDAIGWYGGNSSVSYEGGYDCFGWYFPSPDFCGPQPVCGKLKNPWGLCDMSGNVWEWTWDYYGLYQGTATDPLGPNQGSIRVLRGGSWRYYAYAARAAYRYYISPYQRFCNSGFRLARTLP